MRAAAFDIGSNSLLLTIAEKGDLKPIPLQILVDEAHVAGLSKGLSKNNEITEEAWTRAQPIFENYRNKLQEYRPQKVMAAATEALRRAKNGNQIRQRIEEILGVPVELISGEREADLSFWSVQKELPQKDQMKLVFDIGGASTELCLGNAQGILDRTSLKVGSVVLSEKFGLSESSQKLPEALNFIRELIEAAQWTHKVPKDSLGIGVAGTVTTLFSMELALQTYDRNRVHGKSLVSKRVEFWLREILNKNLNERKKIPGLQPERADVIGGGIAIILGLTKFFNWQQILCMDSGVRFGLLYEALSL